MSDDVTRDAEQSVEAFVRALHRRQLTYTARVAPSVLLPAVAGEGPPKVSVLDPFGDAPALVVGDRAIPTADFRYGAEELRWASGAGADRTTGLLRFRECGLVASGAIATATNQYAVEMALVPPVYDCLLSADAGAHVSTGGDDSIQLTTAGVSWDSATWIDAGLQISYTVVPGTGIGNLSDAVMVFTDSATGVTWTPDGSSPTMTNNLVLQFDSAGITPDPDDRSQLPAAQRAFTPIFPTRMLAELDPTTFTFVGAVVVDETVTPPLVYAVRGSVRDAPSLPAASWVDRAPDAADRAADVAGPAPAPAPAPTLDPTPLTNMSPYEKFTTPQGDQYTEVVQQAAVSDFYDILKSYVPLDLASFVAPIDPATHLPVLPPLDTAVAQIATMPGAKGESAAEWYASLAVPYLTQALSRVDDPGAPHLNAMRARTWMTDEMPSAAVYTAQMPALYARQFGLRYPIQTYLDDQKVNSATYATQIMADAAAWKAEILGALPNAKPEDVKAFTDVVDTLSATGSNGTFWAYWLFRWATKPPALQHIQAVSLAPGQNNSSFAREVQSVCATLSVLDPSGTFTKEYAKVISLVQLTNVLPTLLDYDGKADAFSYIIPKLLDAFLKRYADTKDPDIAQLVQDLQRAVDEGWTADLVNGFLGIAGAITGAYEWRNLTSKLGKLPGDVTLLVSEVVTAACGAAGVALFIIGLDGWDNLDDLTRTNVVAGGIELFVNMVLGLVKRGAAIVQIFSTEASPWEALKIILNPFVDNVAAAQDTVLSASMQRILGRGRPIPADDAYMDADAFFQFQVEAADGPAKLTKTEMAFGRNLDEFALRVGAVFALVNLILSAIALAESTDPMDEAENALFLASAAIELVAYVGGWILGAASVEVIAGVLVATIISACTLVAAVLAVAGLIVLLVLLFAQHDDPTPIQDFATGPAAAAGLYMPLDYDIESFRAYQPSGGPTLAAVALSASASASASQVLHIGADGSLSYAPLDHTTATCLTLLTNGDGLARLCSPVGGATPKVLCLAVDPTTKQLTTAPLDSSDTATGQLWSAALTQVTMADGSSVPATGTFAISSAADPTLFLDLSGPAPALNVVPVSVTLTMTTVQPADLTMADAVLSTNDRDRVFSPRLPIRGSSPLTWTLSPDPPPWLTFDPATGTLLQPLGVAAPVTPSTTYTLTADNQVGRVQATFTVVVTAPALVGV